MSQVYSLSWVSGAARSTSRFQNLLDARLPVFQVCLVHLLDLFAYWIAIIWILFAHFCFHPVQVVAGFRAQPLSLNGGYAVSKFSGLRGGGIQIHS